MITHEQLRDVIGSTVYDSDGDKIGKIGNVYYDDETDQSKWLTVNTGLFGTNETFVPVQGSELAGDGRVTATYDKAMIKDAPNVSADTHLSPEEEQQLYRYYNLGDDTPLGPVPATTSRTPPWVVIGATRSASPRSRGAIPPDRPRIRR
jgi:sporulation protein YlmC with PRC-barrel domain